MLPVTLVFGRPSRAELLALVGCAVLVASAAAWVHTAAQQLPPPVRDEPRPETAALRVTSTPIGASVSIDGRALGTTPVTLDVLPGHHNIVVHAQDAIDEARTVDVDPNGSSLELSLWRDHPSVTYLKPPLPGAILTDAVFLEDGRLGQQVALPDGERQAWTLDPGSHLASQRLGDVASHAALAVRPDGRVVAVLQPRSEPTGTASSLAFSDQVTAGEVWLVPTDAGATPRRVWTAPEPAEELVDLSWAPDEKHLILVGRQPIGTGISVGRTVIRWLGADGGQVKDLALLPRVVAAGTYVWSSDGQTVAFIVHTASLAAVCTLSVVGDFHYLGDLGHDGLAGPPVAPVAWAPDGRVFFGALVSQMPTSGSGSPFSQNPTGLFLAEPADAPGRLFSATPALAPLWWPDRRIMAVGLPSGQETGLRLRALGPQGSVQDVATIDVPAPGPTAYGVRWDLGHRRALVVTNRALGDGPTHDYWLLDFGWAGNP